jgi:thioester reductase-like protein
MTDGAVLLTGATGFLGMEVLARQLDRGERDLITLIRARDDAQARGRLADVLINLYGPRAAEYAPRVTAVAADLAQPGFGLPEPTRRSLARRVETIIHSAACVSFSQTLDDARATNVEGTRAVLDFAGLAQDHGGLARYVHVSTAYVAGTYAGRFGEGDLDLAQSFHNAYEQSKFEAEQLVRARADLPAVVLRPSIVVGDRRSGWTAAFNVLYWPLRAFARGLFTSVPADPAAPVDAVSVDYVADAVHALSEQAGEPGHTYHLVAGAKASTVGEVAELASRYFRRPIPHVVSPGGSGATDNGGRMSEAELLFPYFAMRADFDDRDARACLAPAGITVTPLRDYLERLLDFATLTRWGKRPVARAEALLQATHARIAPPAGALG